MIGAGEGRELFEGMSNTHRRRRRDSTRQLIGVSVGGVYWALDGVICLPV